MKLDFSNKCPVPHSSDKKEVDLTQSGLQAVPYEYSGKMVVSLVLGDNPDESYPERIKPDSILKRLPLAGAYSNTMDIFQGDSSELHDQLAQYQGKTFMANTLFGDAVVTMDPALMRLIIRLENKDIDIFHEDGEYAGKVRLMTRRGSIAQLVTMLMYSVDGKPSLIGSETDEHWKYLHDTVASSFGKDTLALKLPEMDQIANHSLDDIAARGGEITVEVLKQYTLHMMLGVVMGVENEDFSKYERIPEILGTLQKKSQILHMVPLTKHLPNKEYLALRAELAMLMNQFCEEQAALPFIQQVTQLDEPTRVALLSELFAAGHETTANALAWTLKHLSSIKDQSFIMELNAEIALHEGIEDYFTRTDTLLHAAIMETLRLTPVTPSIPIKSTHEFNVTNIKTGESMTIPKNVEFSMHIGAMAYDNDIWQSPELLKRYFPEYGDDISRLEITFIKGDILDGATYNPRRFFDARGRFINFSEFFPFLTGLRTCLGKELATLVLKVMVAKYLNAGNLKLEQEPTLDLSTGVSSPGGLKIQLEDPI